MLLFSIFLGFYLGITIEEFLFIKALVFLLIIFFKLKKKKYQELRFFILFLILGVILNFSLKQNYFYSNVGVVVSSKENYFILQTLSGKYYVYLKNHSYEVFDLLKVNGQLKAYNFPYYESQFDFNLYLKENYIFSQIDVDSIEEKYLSMIRVRAIIDNYLSNFNGESKIIISKLLFNVNVDNNYSSLINDSYLFYYLSISSFHIYLFNGFIKRILQMKLKDKRVDFILMIFTTIFFFLSNYRMSIFRLLFFQIVRFLNYYKFEKPYSRINQISLVYLISGFLNPGSLKGITFFYSFPLYLLLYLSKEAMNFIEKRKRGYYFVGLINIYFNPLQLIQNGYISIFSILYGTFMTPMIIVIFILSLVSFIIPLNFIIDPLILGLKYSILIFNKLNIKCYISNFDGLLVVVFYALMILVLYLMETGRKKKIFKPLLIMGLMLFVSAVPINNLYKTSVYFINVGQGDAILIKDRNFNILIDTGGVKNNDLAVNSLIPFFKKKNVYHLDYLIITHNDYDHYGASESLMINYRINNYYDNRNFKDIKLSHLSLVNLNTYNNLWSDENSSSLVLYLSIYDSNFLLTGDAPKEIERKISQDYANLSIDYLKVGHHGSNTSTDKRLLETFSFKEAIISVGKGNYYSHPHKEVIELLEKYNVKIRRTDLEGTIEYRIN